MGMIKNSPHTCTLQETCQAAELLFSSSHHAYTQTWVLCEAGLLCAEHLF